MFGSWCTCTAGSPALRCRSKISASESLASTNTPRTGLSIALCSGRDARECEHRVHQHVGTRRAIGLRRILQLIVADAVLAGHEYHRRGDFGVEIAGVMAGA